MKNFRKFFCVVFLVIVSLFCASSTEKGNADELCYLFGINAVAAEEKPIVSVSESSVVLTLPGTGYKKTLTVKESCAVDYEWHYQIEQQSDNFTFTWGERSGLTIPLTVSVRSTSAEYDCTNEPVRISIVRDSDNAVISEATVYVSIEHPESYKITFNYNYEGGEISEHIVRYFDPDIKFQQAPHRPMYNFWGWSTDPNADQGEYTLNGFNEHIKTDTVLYAIWGTDSISLNSDDIAYFKSGNSIYCFKYTAEKSGTFRFYTEVSWDDPPYISADGFFVYNSDYSKKLAHDIGIGGGVTYNFVEGETYYLTISGGALVNPVAFRETFTLKYDFNGGPDSAKVYSVVCGSSHNVISVDPERSGHTFLGWSTNKQAVAPEYTFGNKITVGEDITLYAVWEKNKTSYSLTYDGNGYSSYKATKSGELRYTLQLLSSDELGHTFMGWSTDKNATKAEYYPGQKLNMTKNMTLYAVWKDFTLKPKSKVSVYFDFVDQVIYYKYTPENETPCYWTEDESFYSGGLEVAPDIPPVSELNRNRWVDSDGNTVDVSDMIPGEDYYYIFVYGGGVNGRLCFGPECTVTFDANGGIGGTSHITKKYGTVIDLCDIARPQREGYVFYGWASDKDAVYDSSYIWETSTTFADDKTLYAVWKKYGNITDLTYSFVNNFDGYGNYEGFDYDKDYYFSLDVYRNAFGRNTLASTLYNWDVNVMKKTWGGNCYGISATSVMFQSPDTSGSDMKSFNPVAGLISDLSLDDTSNVLKFYEYSKNKEREMTLTEYIEIMQVSQKCQYIQDCYTKNKGDVEGLIQEIEKAAEWTEKHPDSNKYPVVAVFGPEGGHAIVGYSVNSNRIVVYDSNYPGQTRYLQIKRDAVGNYTQWSYQISNNITWSSDREGCWISYVPYEDLEYVWLNRGNSEKLSKSNANILMVDSLDYEIRDISGTLVGECSDGEFTSYDSGVHQIYVADMSENTSGMIMLPTDIYKVVNLGNVGEKFNATMVGENIGANVTTTASEISFTVDDQYNLSSVRLDAQKGDTYNVELISSSDDKSESVNAKGVSSGSQVSLSYSGDNISLNVDENAEITFSVNDNKDVKKIKSVELVRNPNKTQYISGFEKTIDFSGILLKVIYEDGTSEFVSDPDEFYCSGFDFTKFGLQTVNIEYSGFIVSFDINSNGLVLKILNLMKIIFETITKI